ncbi:MAG: hypothetical protein R3C11_15385 [Planctomycetaceae bacterium]
MKQAVTQRQRKCGRGDVCCRLLLGEPVTQVNFTPDLQAVEADPENITFHDNNNRSIEAGSRQVDEKHDDAELCGAVNDEPVQSDAGCYFRTALISELKYQIDGKLVPV